MAIKLSSQFLNNYRAQHKPPDGVFVQLREMLRNGHLTLYAAFDVFDQTSDPLEACTNFAKALLEAGYCQTAANMINHERWTYGDKKELLQLAVDRLAEQVMKMDLTRVEAVKTQILDQKLWHRQDPITEEDASAMAKFSVMSYPNNHQAHNEIVPGTSIKVTYCPENGFIFHNISKTASDDVKLGKGMSTKAKKGLLITKDRIEVIADLNVKVKSDRVKPWARHTLQMNAVIGQHPNIETTMPVCAYRCLNHSKTKIRAYQKLYDGAVVDLHEREIQTDIDVMSLEFRISCLKAMATALHHIHSLDLVHRDFKLDNVLYKGQDEFALTDHATVKHKNAVEYDNYVGTVGYFPPYQRSLGKPQTQVWDVFAFTCSARALFGKYPAVMDYFDSIIPTLDIYNVYISPLAIERRVLAALRQQSQAIQADQNRAALVENNREPEGNVT